MIVDSGCMAAAALDGRVCVRADVPLAVAALFLGAPGRPSWRELKEIGPIRFGIEPVAVEGTVTATAVPFHRDFGDSCVRCASNADAIAQILPSHRERDPLKIPAALGFAFAQQWARHGLACVHGALLRVRDTGVLVVGQRAAGKSVLAASALAAGGAIISDDFLLAGLVAGQPVGERIRNFLSLRRSWAAHALLDGHAEPWSQNRSGNRAYLQITAGDARFPDHASIDRVWVIARPRHGRGETSTLAPIGQAECYAAVVAAIQPLLLGPALPFERDRLLPLMTRLVTGLPTARIETGQDIVLDPAGAWQRLLGQP
jgi:hypothetical protein